MAHFAKLSKDPNDPTNEVLGVHVVNNKDLLVDGVENEEKGRVFLEKLHNWPYWKQTSYNTGAGQRVNGTSGTPFRKNFAGRGDTYNAAIDGFVKPKPFPSWVLNSTTGQYQAPTSTGNPFDPFLDFPSTRLVLEDQDDMYVWDEDAGDWALQGTPR